jgi:hypothetical protein
LIVFLLTVIDLFDDVSESAPIPNFSSMEHRQLHMFLIQTILALMSKYPESFKTLIHRITASVKAKLENILKSISSAQEFSRESSTGETSNRAAQPKIQLKNFSLG